MRRSRSGGQGPGARPERLRFADASSADRIGNRSRQPFLCLAGQILIMPQATVGLRPPAPTAAPRADSQGLMDHIQDASK